MVWGGTGTPATAPGATVANNALPDGTYATLTDIKNALGIGSSDTVDDANLLRVMGVASRWIDGHCQRHFYVKTQTRYYTAKRAYELMLDDDEPDLLSVTTLKTDEDDDYDYDYTWDTGDYHLEPFNVFPKWKITVKALGDYTFPGNKRGVEIAGVWGYGDGASATPYEAAGSNVTVADATGTTVAAVDGTKFQVGQTIKCQTEDMYITGISANNLTVKRAVNGTTGAAHAAQPAYIYRYPDKVREACILRAVYLFRLKDAPLGVSGSTEIAETRPSGIVDIYKLLEDYRRIPVT